MESVILAFHALMAALQIAAMGMADIDAANWLFGLAVKVADRLTVFLEWWPL